LAAPPQGNDPALSVKTFKWTGKNDYVALCETDSISFGGGEGHYGLYLSSTLIEGSSAWCSTFNNEVLCGTHDGQVNYLSSSTRSDPNGAGRRKGKDVTFDCVGVELWSIAMGG